MRRGRTFAYGPDGERIRDPSPNIRHKFAVRLAGLSDAAFASADKSELLVQAGYRSKNAGLCVEYLFSQSEFLEMLERVRAELAEVEAEAPAQTPLVGEIIEASRSWPDPELPPDPTMTEVRAFVRSNLSATAREARAFGQFGPAVAAYKLLADMAGVPMGYEQRRDFDLLKEASAANDKEAILTRIADRIGAISSEIDGRGTG